MQEKWTTIHFLSYDVYAEHTAGVEPLDPSNKLGVSSNFATSATSLLHFTNPVEFEDYVYILLWLILLQCK